MEIESHLRSAVEAASRRDDVRLAINTLYADLQTHIDTRRPICELSGRCCNFDDYGHRLYVTTMELAVFAGANSPPPPQSLSAKVPACPFQRNRLCTVHAIRPFGCRIFFCDPTAQDWQNDLYEQFHARLRRLHDEMEVAYFYVEWRQSLAALFGAA